jgi:8-amino-7-oxononanoate synthase
MLDFTSALYLGLQHPSASLDAWDALTLGRPSAVREPPGADAVAADLARLQGCEAAALLPSTLHLFWDVFRLLGRKRIVILRDVGAYPIARWGMEAAQARGVPVRTFPHHDASALARVVDHALQEELRPIVVSDGFCPRCGTVAPLRAYGEIARRAEGLLVLDDTQALGILGDAPGSSQPYGEGGGGSLRWHQAFGRHVLLGSSLAKGFGTTVAVLAGSREFVDRFRRESDTRLHCSPPSVAVIHAARSALRLNRLYGEALRRRLVRLVARLRQRLTQVGLRPTGDLPFPVQTFQSEHQPVPVLHERLRRSGVMSLLTTACHTRTSSLTFLVNARHGLADVERASQAVADAARLAVRRNSFVASGAQTGRIACWQEAETARAS